MGEDNKRKRVWVFIAAAVAVAIGVIVSILVTLDPAKKIETNVANASLLIIFMIAAIAVAAILGFIFGVPRARTDVPNSSEKPAAAATMRFESNSNLEQISDWLTKILVGAGLVQLAAVPGFLNKLGNYLGATLGPAGPQTTVAIVLYGFGVGFVLAYLWARLRLRVLLETSEADAHEESVRARVTRALIDVNQKGMAIDNRRDIDMAARYADRVSDKVAGFKAVLWVDDRPSNNADLIKTMRELGIEVRLAASTQEALQMVSDDVGLIITDLGRTEEGGYVPTAGLTLTQRVAQIPDHPPIIVYTSRQGMEHQVQLTTAGAAFVTSSPSGLLYHALRLLAEEA